MFIVGPLMDGERCAGAVGFQVRENKFYVFKSKATLVAMGGAVHVFKPRSSGEGMGRAWYPPWNSGSSAYFTIKAGAEMTCQEVRFIPVRFKDAYGPVGAWFLLFKSRATNAAGGNYMIERKPRAREVGPLRPGQAGPRQPAQLPRHAGRDGGQGPHLHADRRGHAGRSPTSLKDDPKAYKKKMKELESEAWEDFLDMTISQAILWAATNSQPEEKRSEIAACRAVLHRLALRRFRAPGSAVPKICRPPRPRTSTSGATRTCPRSRACSARATPRAPPATSSPPARTPRDERPVSRWFVS